MYASYRGSVGPLSSELKVSTCPYIVILSLRVLGRALLSGLDQDGLEATRENCPCCLLARATVRSFELERCARWHFTWGQNVLNWVTAGGLPFPSASVVGNGPLFLIRAPSLVFLV